MSCLINTKQMSENTLIASTYKQKQFSPDEICRNLSRIRKPGTRAREIRSICISINHLFPKFVWKTTHNLQTLILTSPWAILIKLAPQCRQVLSCSTGYRFFLRKFRYCVYVESVIGELDPVKSNLKFCFSFPLTYRISSVLLWAFLSFVNFLIGQNSSLQI